MMNSNDITYESLIVETFEQNLLDDVIHMLQRVLFGVMTTCVWSCITDWEIYISIGAREAIGPLRRITATYKVVILLHEKEC